MTHLRKDHHRRSLLFATTLLAVVTLIGVVGFTRSAAALDRGQEGPRRHCAAAVRLFVAAGAALDVAITDLVADGTLTSAQAEAVRAEIADRVPANGQDDRRLSASRCAAVIQSVRSTTAAVSDLLGIEAGEIRNRVQSGETLLQIAESVDVTRDELIAALQTGLTERLDRAVANGRITADERADIEAASFDRISHVLDTIPWRGKSTPTAIDAGLVSIEV